MSDVADRTADVVWLHSIRRVFILPVRTSESWCCSFTVGRGGLPESGSLHFRKKTFRQTSAARRIVLHNPDSNGAGSKFRPAVSVSFSEVKSRTAVPRHVCPWLLMALDSARTIRRSRAQETSDTKVLASRTDS